MKPYLKYIFLAAAVLLIFGIYLFNKPHKNVSRSEPDYVLEARALFLAFEFDEAAANAKYLDKVIEVSGAVREVTEDEKGRLSITLDTGNDFFGVLCELQADAPWRKADFRAGEPVVFKGLCTGMAMDVVLVRCVRIS
jgi:hypothetical protein